jgi:hypothetical protein
VEKLTDYRDLAPSRWQGQFACRRRHLLKDQKRHGKLTIAVGRNLTDRGLADDEIDYLFANDLVIALQICQDLYPSFASFTPARQAALISMAFNLRNGFLPVFAGCAGRFIATIGMGRLMKPKTTFGRVKNGTAPTILPPGFAVCISRKMTRTDAPYLVRVFGRG